MLEVVKTALRISHNQLDSEITDLIEAARLDLSLSGVSTTKANDDSDPLIKRAKFDNQYSSSTSKDCTLHKAAGDCRPQSSQSCIATLRGQSGLRSVLGERP